MSKDDIITNEKRPVVFITGAAKRIGRALALDLAESGWDVAVHYNQSKEAADDLIAELMALGAGAVGVCGDLADPKGVSGLIQQCVDSIGAPQCLINNASLFEDDTLETLTLESWDVHMNINLRAPVMLAQAFVKVLPEGVDGNIINIIDQKVHNLTPYFYSYTVSKSGLWAATQTMAQALAPRIRVNAIGPGPILQSIHQTPEEFDRQCKAMPLERGASPEEIASGVHFILDAPSMTGQIIMLDGGQHITWRKSAKRKADS